MSRKRILQLVCVTASVATLLWLLQRIGWSTIGTALSQVGWLSATVLFLLALAEGVFDGIALRVVTGPSLSTWFTIAVNSAGSLLNLVLPWESGEILKGGLMRQTLGTSEAVSSTVIWNYVFKISRPAFGLALDRINSEVARRNLGIEDLLQADKNIHRSDPNAVGKWRCMLKVATRVPQQQSCPGRRRCTP